MGYYDIDSYQSYEKKYSEADEEIKKLKEKIRKIKSRTSQDKRKARNHLMILIGAEVLRCTEYDFESEDFDLKNWRSYCNQYAKGMAGRCVRTKRQVPDPAPAPEGRLESPEAPASEPEESQEYASFPLRDSDPNDSIY